MSFYRQSECYEPCYRPGYQPFYEPCYPQCGYGGLVDYPRGTGYNDPCGRYGGYGYNYGNGGYPPQGPLGYGCGSRYGSPSLQPCSYGYRYTCRGGCYCPRRYRCGYGCRRDFPSRCYNSGRDYTPC